MLAFISQPSADDEHYFLVEKISIKWFVISSLVFLVTQIVASYKGVFSGQETGCFLLQIEAQARF